MSCQPKIGIAVAANNIELSVIHHFSESALKTLQPNDDIEISTEPTFGPYNKSRHINDCIRKLIAKQCDIIVQTNIDNTWTEGLINETRRKVKSRCLLWSYAQRYDGNTNPQGDWNAMTSDDWLRVGGLDERCFRWGGEGESLHNHCRELGFLVDSSEHLLNHLAHAKRPDWTLNIDLESNRKRNLQAGRGENHVNYLEAALPEYRGITLHVTSRCLKNCPECCFQDFMKTTRQYEMTLDELDDFVQAIELSPYDYDVLKISGGEPLLCPILPQILERLSANRKIGQIILFTSLLEGFDISSLPPFRGEIRISKYVSNRSLVEQAQRDRTHHLDMIDSSEHVRLPDRLYPESIPGTCFNREVFIYHGRAYTCPLVTHNLVRFHLATIDSPEYSEPLTHRFLDRIRGWNSAAMLPCSGCGGNLNMPKITGTYIQ